MLIELSSLPPSLHGLVGRLFTASDRNLLKAALSLSLSLPLPSSLPPSLPPSLLLPLSFLPVSEEGRNNGLRDGSFCLSVFLNCCVVSIPPPPFSRGQEHYVMDVYPTKAGTIRAIPTAKPLVVISDGGRNLCCSRLL